MGANVSNGTVKDVTGMYGLSDRNEEGDMLIQFCYDENMIIMNNFCKLYSRRFYTWKSQIVYIMINKRYQNSISRVAAYPREDIG